ncbi:MAG: orotidine-5'-phosphate decarboxylase [Bacteroidia bacterium]
MTKQQLIEQIKQKQSFLCIGLDPDLNKIPKHLLTLEDPIFEFNKQIIDATKDYCVAYKPNVAFYECLGPKGWESLKKTLDYIPKDIFTIADAKRGDIGNTSDMYALTFFEYLNADAVTVAPYMGSDSVTPFLKFKNKWVVLLALTSNEGSKDFQLFSNGNTTLFEEVITKSQQWGSDENVMYVIGATRGEDIAHARKLAPKHFFLVPGVGAQGGSLQEVCKYGLTKDCGLLVNSSRGIIYTDNSENFAQAAKEAAKKLQEEMKKYLQQIW